MQFLVLVIDKGGYKILTETQKLNTLILKTADDF